MEEEYYYDDQVHEPKNLQNLTDHQIGTSISHFLKKATKLLLSLSVFSFLLSRYCYSSFIMSTSSTYKVHPYSYFSTLILPVPALNFDKNYMFLIFNGILMFIARMSRGLLQYNSRPDELNYDDHHRGLVMIKKGNLQSAGESYSWVVLEREGIFIIDHQDHDDDQLDMLYNSQAMKEEGSEILLRSITTTTTTTNVHHQYPYLKLEDEEQAHEAEEEEEEAAAEEEGTHDDDHVAAENYGDDQEDVIIHESHDINGNFNYQNGHQDAGNIGGMSTEELNKKFDEFIRRMKEEIRIDHAQRQLIMV